MIISGSNNENRPNDKPQPPTKYLQEEFLENVSEEISLDGPYLVLLIFSTLIAALGLLTNSAAVVIGAMLISPLFWPILGITLSLISSRQHLARRSLLNIGVSIIIILLIGYLVAEISPINQITQEISSRTNPTLLDLIIALAASVVGVLAIYHPRVSQSTSGVAISIALLPALCVSGIGIAFGSLQIFLGSFLLFATNMGAIIFIGAITLYLLKFRPRLAEEKTRMKWGLTASFFFIVLLSIPLSYFLAQTLSQNRIKAEINKVLTEQLTQISDQSQLDELAISFPAMFSSDTVSIKATVLLPEGNSLTNRERNQLIDALSAAVNKDIDLHLNMVNSLVLRREEDEALRELRQEIRSTIATSIINQGTSFSFENIEITFPDAGNETPVEILLVMRDYDTQAITYNDKLRIEQALINRFERPFQVEVEFIPIQRLSETTELSRLEDQIEELLKQELSLDPSLRLVRFDFVYPPEELSLVVEEASTSAVLGIQSAQIRAIIEAPTSYLIDPQLKDRLLSALESEIAIDISLEIEVVRYESL